MASIFIDNDHDLLKKAEIKIITLVKISKLKMRIS